MPRPMPEPKQRTDNTRARWRISPGSWLIVPAGVGVGVLLFLVVWMQRDAPGAVDEAMLPAVTVGAGPETPSLPAPQVSAQDVDAEDEAATGVFTLPDAPAAPPPQVAGSAPTDPAPEDAPAGDGEMPGDRGAVLVHSPPPAYPARSLRRGDSGEVLVRALVGTDGRPRQVEVARSSSHRALDRAAVRAVRSWRFEPATRQGQPVAQVVQVPVAFSP